MAARSRISTYLSGANWLNSSEAKLLAQAVPGLPALPDKKIGFRSATPQPRALPGFKLQHPDEAELIDAYAPRPGIGSIHGCRHSPENVPSPAHRPEKTCDRDAEDPNRPAHRPDRILRCFAPTSPARAVRTRSTIAGGVLTVQRQSGSGYLGWSRGEWREAGGFGCG